MLLINKKEGIKMNITKAELNQLKQLVLGYYLNEDTTHDELKDMLKLIHSHKKCDFIIQKKMDLVTGTV
jgi:hypothetical protein